MEHPIGALPRTPFPASRDFPSRGNEKIGGTGYCVTYDTDSQSRNASCVPFRGRGPQSGEGVDGGNPDYDTRCGRDCRRWPSGPWCQGLCRKVASLRSGDRRLAVRIMMEHHIGAMPRTPFPASREFAPDGKHVTGFAGRGAPPMNPVPLPPPQFGGAAKGKRLNGQARRLTSPHLEVLCRTSTGDYKAPLCCELLMKGLLFRALLSHRSAGGRWCRKAPKGGKPPEVADRRNAYHAIWHSNVSS